MPQLKQLCDSVGELTTGAKSEVVARLTRALTLTLTLALALALTLNLTLSKSATMANTAIRARGPSGATASRH
jgi:hypothetical protein